MLQITETAASVFRDILAQEDVPGTAIRIASETQPDGREGIALLAIEEPELADSLEDAVLDARPSEQGPEFFLRPQERPAS